MDLKTPERIDLDRPTNLAFNPSDSTLNGTQEGSEATVPPLLTSFGIAIPGSSLSADLASQGDQSAAGVLVLSGPGLPAAVNLPAAHSGQAASHLPSQHAPLDGRPGDAGPAVIAEEPPVVTPETGFEHFLRSDDPGAGKNLPGWTLGSENQDEPDDNDDDVFQQDLFPDLEVIVSGAVLLHANLVVEKEQKSLPDRMRATLSDSKLDV